MPQQLAAGLLSWASILEDKTREQAERTASLPWIRPHVALMPDAHWGMGSTVGSVIPTKDVVLPAAVGVDIGCGMSGLRTHLGKDDLEARGSLTPLREAIEREIPVSMGKYRERVSDTAAPRIAALEARAEKDRVDADGHAKNWRLQLGSLGSGNHFIEVCLDESDRVWVFLHSGSRGIGNRIARKHVKRAQELCERWYVTLPHKDLAFLPQGSDEFWEYIRDLRWAQAFAAANRAEMVDRVVGCLAEFAGEDVRTEELITCFAGETEVVTRTGTRPIEALAGGCHELLTSGGDWTKAPVRSFGRQEVSEVLLSRSGVLKRIRATDGHRWLLRSRRGHEYEATTRELRPGNRLQFCFARRPDDLTVNRTGVARGFVFGDGSCLRPRADRTVANFFGAKDAALMPYFEGLGNPPRSYYEPHRNVQLTRITGLPGNWKERPSLDSDPSDLYGWLAGYFAADGDVGKTGRPTLASADRDTLEYLRLLCQTIGVGTFGIRTRLRMGFNQETPSAIHLVGLMRGDLDPEFFIVPAHRARFEAGRCAAERRGWNVVSVRPTGETVEVYCAVVDDTHSFALADNILTGNCHHNYTEQEEHFGQTLWITRKGAINASAGKRGLIPGSMGTRSYVVTGLGNKAAFCSAPHGAGRNFSRAEARKRFTVDQLADAMKGIEWRSDNADAFLDEIPGAYKDIDQIMVDAADLVRVDHTLRQILNVKGD